MTQQIQNHDVKSHNGRSFQRMLRALCVASAFGGVVALAQDARAEQRCTSKPAVCALQAMQKANQAQQPEKAAAPVKVKQVQRVKRCTSKPAVCALQRTTEPRVVVATEVVREAPVVKRCTSKPAVCALNRSKEIAKAQQ